MYKFRQETVDTDLDLSDTASSSNSLNPPTDFTPETVRMFKIIL